MESQKTLKLTIYTDDTYTAEREVRTAEKMKIPYRVGQYVIKAVAGLDLNDDKAVLAKLLESEEQITAVVRATFGLTDEDLDHVDLLELSELAGQIIDFVLSKINDLGAGDTVPPTAAQA